MTSPPLERLVLQLDRRAAATPLLRRMGFSGRLATATRMRGLPDVRRVSRVARDTLAAYFVELGCDVDPGRVRATARALRTSDGVRHHVLLLVDASWSRLVVALDAPGLGLRSVTFERAAIRASDIDVLRELESAPGEGDSAVAMRIFRALDRTRIGSRFFRDVVSIRDRISRCWSGLPLRATADRDALALLTLSRLMFLYFLQRHGLLAGDTAFLPNLLREWLHDGRGRRSTFYRARLRVLFFGVLNRRPARRTARALALGDLPYLNGGLFEVHRLERARPDLDLPDEIVASAFADLLEKYRFTTGAEAVASYEGPDAGGVDPEMLGRIFEGLMPGDRRERTGTFYTPSDTVGRVVADTLTLHLAGACDIDAARLRETVLDAPVHQLSRDDAQRVATALNDIRILDPACGSGAFLLGALAHVTDLRRRTETVSVDATALRREVVARCLHGVDLLEDAALICSLRLWLTLVPHDGDIAHVQPLPNLDRRIRQGDALVDPLDVGAAFTGRPLDTTAPPELRRLTAQLDTGSREYLVAGPERRPALRSELERIESRVARAWLAALDRRLAWEARDLTARAADRDLFGGVAAHAHSATKRLHALQRKRAELAAFNGEVNGRRRLPFFSFRVHFAEAQDGFDVILSNPPWIRAHHWPPAARTLLRERYHVCASAGWPAAAQLAGVPAGTGAQVDLSLLFLERSIRLLRPGGTLGMLLPAKLLRSLYAGGAREMLSRSMHVASIDDYSLDHRTIFDADAFTTVLLARRPRAEEVEAPAVRITLRRRNREPLSFSVSRDELPLVTGDDRSPWLLVPPGCRDALRTMQRNGRPLGQQVTIRRGVMTGANEVLVVRDVEPKLGDMAHIRTDGYHRAVTAQGRRAYVGWVEASVIRPALRGTDIAAWRTTHARHVLWTPHNGDPRATAPTRLKRFLRRHRGRLRQQDHELGALQRLSHHTLGHKVVWSDLATDLRAAAVPPRVRASTGLSVPVVPLNSAYFVAVDDAHDALLLAAYMNSLPVRTFARAVAERAKDAHFRFFAWTLAVTPLPPDWRTNPHAERLLAISRAAHRSGGIATPERNELDHLVAAAYGLNNVQLDCIAAFDAWLAGSTLDGERDDDRTDE